MVGFLAPIIPVGPTNQDQPTKSSAAPSGLDSWLTVVCCKQESFSAKRQLSGIILAVATRGMVAPATCGQISPMDLGEMVLFKVSSNMAMEKNPL